LAPTGFLAGKGVTKVGELTTARFVAGEGMEAALESLPGGGRCGARSGEARGTAEQQAMV
jgi:hypothetical protein